MTDLITYEQLTIAFLELLDGINRWEEIQHFTGLSEARCKNILDIRNKLEENNS
jgi:hypothetical protein